jgi:hypothetical protein
MFTQLEMPLDCNREHKVFEEEQPLENLSNKFDSSEWPDPIRANPRLEPQKRSLLLTAPSQMTLDFEFGCPYIEAEYYREGAQDLIHRLVPRDLLIEDQVHYSSQRARFADLLPIIRWSELSKAPCALSILLLSKYRLNGCNFFYDMISRWLIPQRRVNVELFFSSDVRLPHLSDELLSVAEIVIHLKSAQDVEEARRNLHQIETEIRLGIVSNFHARRILEFKGLSSDGKTAMIQEKIGSLIQRHSKDYDQGIFSQMQQFLVTCPEDFKNARNYHHISRVISNLHSIRKLIKQNMLVQSNKRHVQCKFLRTRLEAKGERGRNVLGVLAGLNFTKEHEVFKASHLIAAIQKHIPDIRLVTGSDIVEKFEANLQTNYLEVEKLNGLDFTLDEIQLLRTALPDEIQEYIGELAHPIFMPRNEEEVLRNIMALSRQLRFVSDLPQVVITFDEQKGNELFFTVVMVRLCNLGEPSLQELFANQKGGLKYIPDRVRKVGNVRSKTKEATVFRTALPLGAFLRPNHSVDLSRAREFILKELTRVVGAVRDYNGGMILKLNESLSHLKGALGKIAEQHPLLLEKFFYAIVPIEMRSSLDTEPLKHLFLTLLQAMKSDKEWVFRQDAKRVFVVGQKKVSLNGLSIPHHQLVSFSVDAQDNEYTGYLFLDGTRDEQERFLHAFTSELSF